MGMWLYSLCRMNRNNEPLHYCVVPILRMLPSSAWDISHLQCIWPWGQYVPNNPGGLLFWLWSDLLPGREGQTLQASIHTQGRALPGSSGKPLLCLWAGVLMPPVRGRAFLGCQSGPCHNDYPMPHQLESKAQRNHPLLTVHKKHTVDWTRDCRVVASFQITACPTIPKETWVSPL